MNIYLDVSLLIAIVALVVVIAISQSKHTFVCGECGKEFNPKWTQLIFEVHSFDEHVVVCPHCHKRSFCKDIGR